MASLNDLVEQPLLKVDRAKKHINELDRVLTAYLVKRPFRWSSMPDTKPGEVRYFIEQEKPIPDDVALIIGDAAHNLRSALDLLCFAMVGAKTPRPWDVQFPFTRKPDAVIGAIAQRQIKFAGDDVQRAIVALKPYPDGHPWLYELHQLDVGDKHKLIITIGSTAVMSAAELNAFVAAPLIDLTAEVARNMRIRWPVSTSITVIGDPNRFGTSRHERRAQNKSNLQAPFEVVFGPKQPFADQAVVPQLRQLAIGIADIVNDLARTYIGDAANR